MITRIEATRYRCLELLQTDVQPYGVLVGANGRARQRSWTFLASSRTAFSSGRLRTPLRPSCVIARHAPRH